VSQPLSYPPALVPFLDGEHHTDELCCRFSVGWPTRSVNVYRNLLIHVFTFTLADFFLTYRGPPRSASPASQLGPVRADNTHGFPFAAPCL